MTNKTKIKNIRIKDNSLLPYSPTGFSPSLQKRLGAPKFKLIKENTFRPEEKDINKFRNQMNETVGAEDIDFFATLITQVSNINADVQNNKEIAANFSSAFMYGLQPKDQTEGILFAQMAGTHNLIMEYMRRAIIPGQHLEAAEDYTNRACKLMNIFIRQIETLEKYRGKSTQQKVIVEHVHVEEGGKAIVGNVEQPVRGEGDEQPK